jgi:hypothetical protein
LAAYRSGYRITHLPGGITMQLRYRNVLPLVAICLALAIAPAFAAKPQPTQAGTPSGTQHEIKLGETQGTANTNCQLGVPPPAFTAFGYILPPDDEYYQLINPADCAGCNGGPVLLTAAHIALYFTAPCQIPVTVMVRPAITLGPGCLGPNPFGAPICAPAEYQVNDGGILNDCVDYSFPLPAACCLQGPAFLEFQFDQGTCATSRPAFCGPASCVNCQQYNFYPGASFPGDDLCAVLTPFGVYGINIWADATCCGATPTHNGSWGQLKTLYR